MDAVSKEGSRRRTGEEQTMNIQVDCALLEDVSSGFVYNGGTIQRLTSEIAWRALDRVPV